MPRVIDQALLMMEDWTNGVTFDPAEVDKERGVILEEWRLGLGADARMQNTIMPILLQGSRYAERSPIGTPDSIRNAPYARLKQFYTDWYRPDLMAVIIVGDFDPKAIEAGIKAHFGPIPAAVSPRPRTAYTVPAHAGTLYAVATDREATEHDGRSDRQDAGARPAHRRHVPPADGGAAVQRHAVGSARRDLTDA